MFYSTHNFYSSKKAKQIFIFALLAITDLWPTNVLADPPFITNNAKVTDYQHLEVYFYSLVQKDSDSSSLFAPATELDYGLLSNLQLHLIVPMLTFFPTMGPSTTGIGDIEAGINYRFIQESEYMPQVAIFPMAELSAGDASRNLGNGHTWYRVPLEIQKSWGDWTAYSQLEYNVNNAPGMDNYWDVGFVLQKQITPKLALGTEVYTQGAMSDQDAAFTLLNMGAIYNFTPKFALQASIGHSIIGAEQAIGFLGLYWNLG